MRSRRSSKVEYPAEQSGTLRRLTISLIAYQTEIDNLTRRCKTSETAFLSVYKLLAEAPDPYPLLDAAVVRSHRALHSLSTTTHRV